MAVTGDRPDVIREPEDALQAGDATGPARKNAVTAGVLLIVATAASLLSGPFLAPVTDSDYLTGAAAHHAQVATGVLLVFIAAFAAPGTGCSPASWSREDVGPMQRLGLTLFGMLGDFRDWNAIRTWSAGIADALREAPTR